MADRSNGEIQIGGKVPRRLLPALIAHFIEEGFLDEDETEADLKPNENKVLAFENNETCGGAFYDLEQFLQKNKIDFDRQASPSYYYDPDNVSWRNGECWSASREATDELRKRIAGLKDDLIDIWANEEAILEFIRRNGPPPELKPFTIVDEE